MSSAISLQKDDMSDVYLSTCCRMDADAQDSELERCWNVIGTLLGFDPSVLKEGGQLGGVDGKTLFMLCACPSVPEKLGDAFIAVKRVSAGAARDPSNPRYNAGYC